MLIDWFTVIAQIVNFLVLVWLLQRFLYAPILQAVDAREKRVAATSAEAESAREAAQKERDTLLLQKEEFSRERTSLLRDANQEAKDEKVRLFEAVRGEVEDFRIRQQQAMIDDCNTLKEEILRRTRDEVFAITRKTLTDLAGEDLEKMMVETFIQRCRNMAKDERVNLRAVMESPIEPIRISSTFALPHHYQEEMRNCLREQFTYAGELRFETSNELICGIALSVDGYEVAWNMADYLLDLEKMVTDLLHSRAPTENAAPMAEVTT